MATQIEITEDEWIDKYKPMLSPVQGYGFDFGDGDTLLDMSEPSEFDLVEQTPDNRIWTAVENDGVITIVSGYHRVNRIGFIITQEAFNESDDISVALDA